VLSEHKPDAVSRFKRIVMILYVENLKLKIEILELLLLLLRMAENCSLFPIGNLIK
jgi:hypothetical protein